MKDKIVNWFKSLTDRQVILVLIGVVVAFVLIFGGGTAKADSYVEPFYITMDDGRILQCQPFDGNGLYLCVWRKADDE